MPKSPKHPHWEDQQANDRAALDCRTVGKGLLYMKMSVYANRIGGFTALNQGKIANCFTDAKIKHSTNVAGFAFENGGDMSHSVVQGKTSGKENVAGFCGKNRGKANSCGWLNRVEPEPEGSEAEKAPETEKPAAPEKKKKSAYTDEGMAINYTDLDSHARGMGFGDGWEIANGKMKHDRKANYHHFPEVDGEEIIEITSADQLTQIANDIAAGDTVAASAHYRLADNINCKGKKILPLGMSESAPFAGTFDGAGHKIHNFKVVAKGLEYAGLFGYVAKEATIANMDVDCVINAKGGTTTGGLCGINHGTIRNCHTVAGLNAEKNCGGFVGKNYGSIEACAFIGSITPIIPLWMYIVPAAVAACLLLGTGLGIMVWKLRQSPYQPIVIDPGSVPVMDNTPIDPPPAGTSRISINLNQEFYVNVTPDPTSGVQAGIADCVNPRRSTEDIVLSVWVSDAELIAKGIANAGFTAEEYAIRSAEAGYDPAKAFQELYRSGRIPIGYAMEVVGLKALPNGTYLPLGDYEMKVVIDPYNPETNEKSVVNAEAPVTVHVVESVSRG